MFHSRKKMLMRDIKENVLIDNTKCGFCGCRKFNVLKQYSEKPDIFFIKCKKCGAVTYNKLYSQEALDKLYADYHYFSENNTYAVTFYGTDRFARHLSKFVDFTGRTKIKILDFGGGDGTLSYFTAKQIKKKNPEMSIEITVVDYCKELYCPDDATGITMKNIFPIHAVEEEYDFIIASAIIEHLLELSLDIKKIFSCLRVGGYAYFRTPYMYPLWRELQKIGIDYNTLYPEHIWDLGDKWYAFLPTYVKDGKAELDLIVSKPSIVQKSFRSNFLIALVSYALKAPWYVFHRWPYVGGWEAVYKKVDRIDR